MPFPSDSYAFLGSFAVAEGVFDLGSKVTPGSIRDQILRTKLFTEHLQTHGFLEGKKRVCVIGAGPAGITAAMRLSRFQNLEVLLVDQNPEPLSILAGSEHRLISPTLYDWPADHYRLRAYGVSPVYSEGTPSRLRERWLYEFEASKTRGLKWAGSMSADPQLDQMLPPWRVILSPMADATEAGKPYEKEFDLLILCRGFGRESGIKLRGQANAIFTPEPFWSLDPYPILGRRKVPDWDPSQLRELNSAAAVVVLGGGDGAIQDMLRFATNGRDTRGILEFLQARIDPGLPSELEDVSAQVENIARHNAFSLPSSELANDLRLTLQKFVERLAGTGRWGELADLIQFTSIRLYFNNETLGPCYALNHFLALLFNRWFEDKGLKLLVPNHEADSIECMHGGDDHYDQTHKIFFKNAPQNHVRGNSEVTCRVVVARIGIDPSSRKCNRTQTSVYHALPYWLADWKPSRT